MTLVERNWLWLLLATPLALYGAWIASMVVPVVVRNVVAEVVRNVVTR